MDFDIEKFSYRLVVLMEEFNLNQKDLSKKVDISNVTISRYISGDRVPRLDVIARLASFFNVSIDYLLGISDNKLNDEKNNNSDLDIALIAKQLFELEGTSHLTKNQIDLIKKLLLANKDFILSA